MYKKPPIELQKTTLWDYPSQHYGDGMQGDKAYKGATPSYVIWNFLMRYTKAGDTILDPMCGSGTTLDVCKDTGRKGVGFDLAPYRKDIKPADARHLPLRQATVDAVFLDPPYSTHLKYSGLPECIGELDAAGPDYLRAMQRVIQEVHRVLRPGGHFGLYVQDSWRKDEGFLPIGIDIFQLMRATFVPVDVITVTRRHKSMRNTHLVKMTAAANAYLRGFNYFFIVRKA